MKAEATPEGEITIELNKGDLVNLKHSLEGKINVDNKEKPLTLEIGITKNNYLYKLCLETFPEGASFSEAERYKIVMCEDAYIDLKSEGYTGEKLSKGVRVDIYDIESEASINK